MLICPSAACLFAVASRTAAGAACTSTGLRTAFRLTAAARQFAMQTVQIITAGETQFTVLKEIRKRAGLKQSGNARPLIFLFIRQRIIPDHDITPRLQFLQQAVYENVLVTPLAAAKCFIYFYLHNIYPIYQSVCRPASPDRKREFCV
jgi:hypothetical protein